MDRLFREMMCKKGHVKTNNCANGCSTLWQKQLGIVRSGMVLFGIADNLAIKKNLA